MPVPQIMEDIIKVIAGCRVMTVQKTVEVPQFLFSLAKADKMVDVPVVVHAWCYGPGSSVPGQRCSFSAGSLTRPLCATTGVLVQTVQFLDKVLLLCPVHMVPDVQKAFGGAEDAASL